MATTAVPVNLGFVKKNSTKRGSKFFSSKVGGFPAWLRLNNLPDRSDIICKKCLKPLVFLLEFSAPISEIASAFYRKIFIFICTNGKCYNQFDNQIFAVFRSQLPRQNEFYSDMELARNKNILIDPSDSKYQPTCALCGCGASIKCLKCSEMNYCSESHRDYDWKWNHQRVCCKGSAEAGTKQRKGANDFLLPEYNLVIKPEKMPPAAPEKSDEEKMKEYKSFMQSAGAPKELQDVPLDELDAVMSRNDKVFNKFKKRINLEPKQVLRYHRGQTPLWVSAEHVPSPEDIPDCVCGAKRIFEFQVMPQLLNYLSLDSLGDSVDWGTLAVYTCSESCENGVQGYAKEFVWKQDFSDCS